MHEGATEGAEAQGGSRVTFRSPRTEWLGWSQGCRVRAASRERQRPNWRELEVQVSIPLLVLKKRKEKTECGAIGEFRQGCGIMKL